MGTVAVAGVRMYGITLRVMDEDRTATWTADHGATVWAVAFDRAGNVIIGGEPGTDGFTVRKYRRTGALLWSYAHGATIYAVAVDSDNNIYIGGAAGTDGNEVRRLSADGTPSAWVRNHGANIYAIAVAPSSGNVLIGGSPSWTDNRTTRLCYYWSNSSNAWSYNHGAPVYAVAIPGTGYYTAGETNWGDGKSTRCHLATGTVQRSYSLPGTARAVCGGDADNPSSLYLLTAGLSSSGYTTRRHAYTSESTGNWTANHGAMVYGATVNAAGEFYTVGQRSSNVTLRKYSASGTLDASWNVDTSADLYAVAWSAVSLSAAYRASPPGLPLAFRLGGVLPGYSHTAPALAWALALGAPLPTAPPLPPEPSVPPLQTLYRCYLTGGPTLLELPIAVFQCRRRVNESAWLTVKIPNYRPALAAAISACIHGQIVLYAGTRSAAGLETLGEMMRAWLTETDITREAGSAWIHLTGRILPTPFTTQTRTLQGIETRGKTDGRWQVRCAVDPQLRPNDTVLMDGGISFVVGTMTYQISPHTAQMTVTEQLNG